MVKFSAFSFNVLAKRLQALDGTDVSLKSPDLVPLNLYPVERGEECGENHQGLLTMTIKDRSTMRGNTCYKE